MSEYKNKINPNTTNPVGDIMILQIDKQNEKYESIHGFHILERHRMNDRALKATVVSLGTDAIAYGVNVGDRIMFDAGSTFGRFYEEQGETVITRVCNIICKLDESDHIIGYGTNVVLVKEANEDVTTIEGTDFILPQNSKLNCMKFKLVHSPVPLDDDLNIGDYVLAYNGPKVTNFKYGSEDYLILPLDHIYAKHV